MDLGNKDANNLLSKDYKLAMRTACEIVDNANVAAFCALEAKSEFIFDFIKEKILVNLKRAVNDTNVNNLFGFMKVHSFDFKDFIVHSFAKFNSDEISKKMFEILKSGTNEEKTYALEFFAETKNNDAVMSAKQYLNSDYEPLKSASIRLLALCGEKEEYNLVINTLKSSSDDFEKISCVEFLVNYGDKAAFEPIYEYFINSGFIDTVAYNLVFLKDFKTLIENGEEEKALNIFASILTGCPDNVSFGEINSFLTDGIFEFLFESELEFASLVLLFLKEKINLILDNEAYLIDLDKNDKKEAASLKGALAAYVSSISSSEVILFGLQSNSKLQNIMALELVSLSDGDFSNTVKELCMKTGNSEVLIFGLNVLKQKGALEENLVLKLLEKTENENLGAEIKAFIS